MNKAVREIITFGALAHSVISRIGQDRPKAYIEGASKYALELAECFDEESEENLSQQLGVIRRKVKYLEHMKGRELEDPVVAISALLDIAERLHIKPGGPEDNIRNNLMTQLEGWINYLVRNPAKYVEQFRAAQDVTLKWEYS